MYICTHIMYTLMRLLQAEQFQFSQPFLIREMLQAPSNLCGPPLDSLQVPCPS